MGSKYSNRNCHIHFDSLVIGMSIQRRHMLLIHDISAISVDCTAKVTFAVTARRLFVHISTTRYSYVHLCELEQRGVDEIVQASKGCKRTRTRILSIESPVF